MQALSLDVPQVALLAHELNKRGLNVRSDVFPQIELIEELIKHKEAIAAGGRRPEND